ncbi:hypothetical protein BDZ91DRAFT_765109 [Kalaharituber pfeilii]|nr:hypothetical protein BDZ91DRAFT_765109 [Kalaharituber pfeilii]
MCIWTCFYHTLVYSSPFTWLLAEANQVSDSGSSPITPKTNFLNDSSSPDLTAITMSAEPTDARTMAAVTDATGPAVEIKKENKFKIKKPVFRVVNRPKEVLMIHGRDPSCRQTLTFRQHVGADAPRVLPPLRFLHAHYYQNRNDTHVPERPIASSSGLGSSNSKADRSRDMALDGDEDSGRERKKLRTTA